MVKRYHKLNQNQIPNSALNPIPTPLLVSVNSILPVIRPKNLRSPFSLFPLSHPTSNPSMNHAGADLKYNKNLTTSFHFCCCYIGLKALLLLAWTTTLAS